VSAPAYFVVHGRLVADDPEAEATQLEARAAKLMQRARDIRHTLKLNALVAVRRAERKPCCGECDAEIGTTHFGFCSWFGAGAGAVVE